MGNQKEWHMGSQEETAGKITVKLDNTTWEAVKRNKNIWGNQDETIIRKPSGKKEMGNQHEKLIGKEEKKHWERKRKHISAETNRKHGKP